MSCGSGLERRVRVHVRHLGVRSTVAVARMAPRLLASRRFTLMYSKRRVRGLTAMLMMMLLVPLHVAEEIIQLHSAPPPQVRNHLREIRRQCRQKDHWRPSTKLPGRMRETHPRPFLLLLCSLRSLLPPFSFLSSLAFLGSYEVSTMPMQA
ncbi:hypothetical protein L1049_016607 [Liquidambar formosana]|uniref:Uncharacterized protein n=1 Tax=Liquidambar formosana TaxID=63359 RepID=A0AAP0X6Y8_LIQFO